MTEYSVDSGLKYVMNVKHRNGTKGAGQWSINETEEVQCFELAIHNHWLVARNGWTLHLPDGSKADWLGVADDHVTRAFIAKLVTNSTRDVWHGYPIVNDRNEHSPPREVVRDWLAQEFVSARVATKLVRGRPCLVL